ncbi:MAG TPA: lipopolysaccharide heptosyltransferase II [Burkholderiales bacterium]
MNRAAEWADAERLLCVRLDAMGDVIMTEPALRALKRSGPRRRLTLLTSPAGAMIAPYLPAVDDVIAYAAPWVKATAPYASASAEQALIARLRALRFDGAVVFTVYSQSALPAAHLCYLAEIPRRLAYCRENPYGLLTDWLPETEPEQRLRHEVRRQLDLVAWLGAAPDDERLRLHLPAAERSAAQQRLARLGIAPESRWVIVHPGASAPSRRYPAASFTAVARTLVEAHGCAVVFTGSAEERALIEDIRRGMQAPSHSLAGELTLGELCGLIALAPLLIANNTGPVHIAAAFGTPVVDLYALTNPQHMPWEVENRVLYHNVPCKYCYKSVCPEGHNACLRRVPPAAVVDAALELLTPARAPARARAGD